MVLVAIGLLIAQEGNPIITTPPAPGGAQNVTVHNEITVTAPPPDPQIIADASVQSSESILMTVVAPPPVQFANDLLGLPDVWRTTPDDMTWNNPNIRSLAELLRNVALGLVALAIFAAGAQHALGQGMNYGRLVFGVVLSFGNLVWWEIGIRLNNAINTSIGAPDLPSLIKPHLEMPPQSIGLMPSGELTTLVLLIVYAIVALLLIFSLLFRLGLIDILIAVGSLALLCYATEQSEFLAQHYTRLSVGLLFGQVLVVLGLRVASVLATLGGSGIIGTLLSIVVLLLIRDLPKTLIAGGGAGQERGHGMAAAAIMLIRRRVGL